MRVLFLERQPCMRALKYAAALAAEAPDIELAFAYQGMTLSGFYGVGDDLFSRWYRLGIAPHDDLRRAIDDFAPDVVHSHNLPDVLTVAALDLLDGELPVIHDVHDFQSLRQTPYEDGFPDPPDPQRAERRAVEDSDALVTVGDELVDEIAARYRMPERILVVPNAALRGELPRLSQPVRLPRERPLRVAYQGTLSVGGGHYDLREIFADLLASGAELAVHPSRPAPSDYRELAARHPGLRLFDPLPPAALFAHLTTYDVGWAGFNAARNGAHLDTVLPNKAFEYVACGLPVVALPHRALARWIDEAGTGVVVSSPDRIVDELARVDLDVIRARVRARRDTFTMERMIDGLVDLYAELAGVSTPGVQRA